jgi:hypothetical protein
MKTKHILNDGTVLVRDHAHANGNELDGLNFEQDPFPARLTATEKLTAAKLSTDERKEWHRALKVIDKGWKTFVEVGLALKQIKASRLYREDYASWDVFCRHVVGISKTEANRQIIDAEVVETLQAPIGANDKHDPIPLPANRAQTRALAQIKDVEIRRQIWKQVSTKQDGEPITAHSITKTATNSSPPAPSRKQTAKSRSEVVGGDAGMSDKPNLPDVLEMLRNARRDEDWTLVDSVIALLGNICSEPSPQRES